MIKPRIKYIYCMQYDWIEWECYGNEMWGYGMTPLLAYKAWLCDRE